MIGKRLNQLRKTLNITQEKFSTQFAVSYRAYTSYERGERKPSFELLNVLYKNFNVNLNWLISGEGEMFNVPQKDLSDFDLEVKVDEILRKKGFIK